MQEKLHNSKFLVRYSIFSFISKAEKKRFIRRAHKPGFTFIEILVAITILGIAIVPMVGADVLHIRGFVFSATQNALQALHVRQRKPS